MFLKYFHGRVDRGNFTFSLSQNRTWTSWLIQLLLFIMAILASRLLNTTPLFKQGWCSAFTMNNSATLLLYISVDSSLLRADPPCFMYRYFLPRAACTCRFSLSTMTQVHLFPLCACKRLTCASTRTWHLGRTQFTPRLTPRMAKLRGFVDVKHLSMPHQRFTFVRLPFTHLIPSQCGTFSSNAHHLCFCQKQLRVVWFLRLLVETARAHLHHKES